MTVINLATSPSSPKVPVTLNLDIERDGLEIVETTTPSALPAYPHSNSPSDEELIALAEKLEAQMEEPQPWEWETLTGTSKRKVQFREEMMERIQDQFLNPPQEELPQEETPTEVAPPEQKMIRPPSLKRCYEEMGPQPEDPPTPRYESEQEFMYDQYNLWRSSLDEMRNLVDRQADIITSLMRESIERTRRVDALCRVVAKANKPIIRKKLRQYLR